MRSNDLFLGLPYDVFLFTFLQELMSIELGVQLGTYFHYAGSMHAYDRDGAKIASIASASGVHSMSMPALENPEELLTFTNVEREIRQGNPSVRLQSRYWRDLAGVLEHFRASKFHDSAGAAALLNDNTYRRLLTT
jgi:thymidylate synthase